MIVFRKMGILLREVKETLTIPVQMAVWGTDVVVVMACIIYGYLWAGPVGVVFLLVTTQSPIWGKWLHKFWWQPMKINEKTMGRTDGWEVNMKASDYENLIKEMRKTKKARA